MSLTATAQKWIDGREGKINSYEKVPHTFLCESSGEMYCDYCKATEQAKPNRRMDFMAFLEQKKQFERFTEQHEHAADREEPQP